MSFVQNGNLETVNVVSTYDFGGSLTIESQNDSIDFITLINWLRSIGFVIKQLA